MSVTATATRAMVATSLPMDLIDDDPGNVRTSIGDVTELRRSMATDGLLQPIIVYRTDGDRYMAWAGHRRRKAARELGWTHIDAVIRDAPANNVTRIVLQLTENGQRKDLNYIEEAKAYRQLVDEGLTQQQVAERCGKTQTTVSTRLDLLAWLTDDEQAQVANKQLSLDRAKKIVYDRKADKHVGRADRGEARPAASGPVVPWFTRAHPLAGAAADRCLAANHSDQLRFGGACGQCWEAAIRRDERLHTPTQASSNATETERRLRCNRCELDGSARRQPCHAGGKTFAQHDYELIARPPAATAEEATT